MKHCGVLLSGWAAQALLYVMLQVKSALWAAAQYCSALRLAVVLHLYCTVLQVKSKYVIEALPAAVPTGRPSLDTAFPKIGVGGCCSLLSPHAVRRMAHAVNSPLAISHHDTLPTAHCQNMSSHYLRLLEPLQASCLGALIPSSCSPSTTPSPAPPGCGTCPPWSCARC